ncbi:MAG: AgmX/PglI C-terminal domain-containing protein [Stagnimonas sp.]|nr:AgmX/PglI C-terminal domain-containing protein [Stagnimonas sp.]
MSALAVIRWDGYEYGLDSDRRFRKLLLVVAIPFLLLVLLSSLYKIEGQLRGGGTYDAPVAVELLPSQVAPLAEQIEEPAPAEEDSKEEPVEAAPKLAEKPVPKPVPNAEPVPDPVETAREVAKRSGVLAFSQALSELRNKGDASGDDQPLLSSKGAASTASGGASSGESESALASASAGSSGIGGAGSAGVTRSQSGTGLGKRRTTNIESPVGYGRDASKAGLSGDARAKGRSYEEIQLQFSRAAGAFNAMYMRALRQDASLAGKVWINLTIAPDGSVTDANMDESQLNEPDLEAKIIARVKLMKFPAKDVPPFTFKRYWIVFTPPTE